MPNQSEVALQCQVEAMAAEIVELKRTGAEDTMARKEAEIALQKQNKELDQFVYAVSHDLKEPLRMVSNFTQLLADDYKGKFDKNADQFIAFAVDGATRIQAMIDGLLTYSLAGTSRAVFTPVSCEDVLNKTLKNLNFLVKESRANVTVNPLPMICADGVQMGTLFQNLIENAIKYHGDAPPRIDISVEKSAPSEYLFSVKDNGIGIDPKFHERIFILFQRLHARKQYSGLGIGLSICKKIVERHGGQIWVTSELGTGATFYFTLPCPSP